MPSKEGDKEGHDDHEIARPEEVHDEREASPLEVRQPSDDTRKLVGVVAQIDRPNRRRCTRSQTTMGTTNVTPKGTRMNQSQPVATR